MAPSRRNVRQLAEESSTPPEQLSEGQSIGRVIKAEGNNLYSVELPSKRSILVELPSRFRSTIWMRRGGYVLADMSAFDGRENKLQGEIVNVVRDEKEWRKQSYWPAEFPKTSFYDTQDQKEGALASMMPPAEDDS